MKLGPSEYDSMNVLLKYEYKDAYAIVRDYQKFLTKVIQIVLDSVKNFALEISIRLV